MKVFVGKRRGIYEMVSTVAHAGHELEGNVYEWRCVECGARELLTSARASQRKICRHDADGVYRSRKASEVDVDAHARASEARMSKRGYIDPSTRYEDDVDAQEFVSRHPDGATLDQVAEAFGVTRERARQIEEGALHKIFRRRASQLQEHAA